MFQPKQIKNIMIDIGANFTDDMFKGIYHGKQKHKNDLADVLDRSNKAGVKTMILTVGCVEELQEAKDIVQEYQYLYYTFGIHPTRANTFKQSNINIIKSEICKLGGIMNKKMKDNTYLQQRWNNIIRIQSKNDINSNNNQQPDSLLNRWIMYGEFGLDYDRLHFSNKEQQIQAFKGQLPLAASTGLPLFLHARGDGAVEDLLRCIDEFCTETDLLNEKNTDKQNFFSGVVHSFTGTVEEAQKIVSAGFYIGLNGCSFKEESGKDVLLAIGLKHVLTETDCPYCGVKCTHFGYQYIRQSADQRPKPDKFVEGCGTKDRSEPADVDHIIQIISSISGESKENVINIVKNNLDNMIRGTMAEIFYKL